MSAASEKAASWPIVVMPRLLSFFSLLAHQKRHRPQRHRRQERGLLALRHFETPSGFALSEAIFAIIRLVPMPTEAARPVCCPDRGADAHCRLRGRAYQASQPVMSIYASSRPPDSTSGVKSAQDLWKTFETRSYSA